MTDVAQTLTQDVIVRILAACAEAYGVTIVEMLGTVRTKMISQARGAAAYLLRKRQFSYPEIGVHLGGKDHTSVRTAVLKLEAAIASGADQPLLDRLSAADRHVAATGVRYRVPVPAAPPSAPVKARVVA